MNQYLVVGWEETGEAIFELYGEEEYKAAYADLVDEVGWTRFACIQLALSYRWLAYDKIVTDKHGDTYLKAVRS